MTADDMVDMTARWRAEGSPAPVPGRLSPPAAYASATAFEPAEDAETLEAVCLLIAVAYPAEAAAAEEAGSGDPDRTRPAPWPS